MMLQNMFISYTASDYISGFKRMTCRRCDLQIDIRIRIKTQFFSQKVQRSLMSYMVKHLLILFFELLFRFMFDRHMCVGKFCLFCRLFLIFLGLMRVIYTYGVRLLHSSVGQLLQYFDIFLGGGSHDLISNAMTRFIKVWAVVVVVSADILQPSGTGFPASDV